jgi:hypothetical protein
MNGSESESESWRRELCMVSIRPISSVLMNPYTTYRER